MENNKILAVALSIILAFATVGCTQKRPYQVRQDCYAAIKAYVAEHKEYNSFLLLSTQKLFNEDGKHPGFLIPISDYLKPDSVLIFNYGQQRIYNHNRLINYLKRAKLLYFEQGKLCICNSPDTLYLPLIKIDSPVRSEEDR